jgi:FtsP/CotA-like multicopper oxidase with cupredoxin domain
MRMRAIDSVSCFSPNYAWQRLSLLRICFSAGESMGISKEIKGGEVRQSNRSCDATRATRCERGASRRRFLFAAAPAAVAGLLGRRAFALPATARPDIFLHIAPIEIEIASGHSIRTMAYNGGSLGSPIRVAEGRSIQVEILNESGREEYVHWHGFSLEARFDGTEEEDSLSVPAHSRVSYTLPPQTSGSYYVHSHAMACHDLSAGMYSGQFAFVHVEPKQDAGCYDREIFLTSHEWEPRFVNMTQEARSAEEMLHLRIDAEDEGERGEGGWDVQYRLASLNGKALGHGDPIRVKRGERVLIHFLNASATENIQLALPGHQFLVQGLDGSRVPNAAGVSILEMGVGERIDAIVEMTSPGVWVLGSTDDETRGKGLGVVVEYAGAHGEPVWSEPAAPTWSYGIFGNERELESNEERLQFRLTRLALGQDGFERWALKGDGQHDLDSSPVVLRQGTRYRLRISNESGEYHPLHLHRYRFELAELHGNPSAGLIKDTVVVSPYESVEVIVKPEQTGLALFHCHNQMHMDSGLKTLFRVQR